MRTIILNSTNLVAGSNNSALTYLFPAGAVEFKNDLIAVSSISMFYSWFNINAQLYNNNKYNYIWRGVSYTVTMPNGNYSVAELNTYLQNVMIANGHYLVNSASQNVYYLEWILNTSYYAVQLNSYPIPTALPSGWTNPAGLTFPAVAETPQIQILSTNNFKDIVGFNAGTYPNPVQATVYSKLSDNAPQVSPISSIILECDLINNPYSTPSKLIYSFAVPNSVSFGENIAIQPPEFVFNEIQNGFYNQLTLTFRDQQLRTMVIQDPQMVILLTIKKKEQVNGKLINSIF
jgi:hypothetical protein